MIADQIVAKGFRLGTHRTIAPAETLAKVLPLAEPMGITRLANVTGLDYLSLPVVMAMRPDSLSLSVSQGKGLDLVAAKASAFMEAAESFHAERAVPAVIGRLADLPKGRDVVDWTRLPRLHSRSYSPEAEIAWSEATDIVESRPVWVPYEMVHTNYSVPLPAGGGFFPLSSNGLASGNSMLEATCAGLMELIERDATTLWAYRSSGEKARRRIDLASVDHPICREVIDRLEDCAMALTVWDVTSDIGIAAFLCRLEEGQGNPRSPLGPFYGAGCHLARDVAFLRAVTEAAQSRLTDIAGSRDDLRRHEYGMSAAGTILGIAIAARERQFPARSYRDVPDVQTDDFRDDLRIAMARLRDVGLNEVAVVDLTRPDIGIPAVRVIVPGLEFIDDDPDFAPGERAQSIGAQNA